MTLKQIKKLAKRIVMQDVYPCGIYIHHLSRQEFAELFDLARQSLIYVKDKRNTKTKQNTKKV